MLHLETVEPQTYAILKQLMALKTLEHFSLVGGTALSLRYGHRTSVDIDLFCDKKFNTELIANALKEEFGNGFITESKTARWGIFCYLNDLKVDIIHHPHPIIDKIEEIDTIRIYSDKDIIAMKLNAILGRGRKKDFWDLFELLHHYSLADMIEFHKAKYSDQNLLITIPQAIIYFTDAEESEEPISLKGQTWEKVKQFIREKVIDYLK